MVFISGGPPPSTFCSLGQSVPVRGRTVPFSSARDSVNYHGVPTLSLSLWCDDPCRNTESVGQLYFMDGCILYLNMNKDKKVHRTTNVQEKRARTGNE